DPTGTPPLETVSNAIRASSWKRKKRRETRRSRCSCGPTAIATDEPDEPPWVNSSARHRVAPNAAICHATSIKGIAPTPTWLAAPRSCLSGPIAPYPQHLDAARLGLPLAGMVGHGVFDPFPIPQGFVIERVRIPADHHHAAASGDRIDQPDVL